MKVITTIEWRDASKELPDKRICVLISDRNGYIQESFYGEQSSVFGESEYKWRKSDIQINGLEPELDFIPVLWAYYPKSPLASIFRKPPVPLCSTDELNKYFILEDDTGKQKPLEFISEFLK